MFLLLASFISISGLTPGTAIAVAVIGFLASLIPIMYSHYIAKKKKKEEYASDLAETIRLESANLRKDLKEDIEQLRKEVEALAKENERLEEENRKLKNRVSELELQVRYYELIVKANLSPAKMEEEN